MDQKRQKRIKPFLAAVIEYYHVMYTYEINIAKLKVMNQINYRYGSEYENHK